MTYQTKPTADGAYRIKVLTQNLFIEDDTTRQKPGLRLASPSSSNQQIWNLARVSGQTDVWTITSAFDKDGLTYKKTEETYWGYGYPYPQSGSSNNWTITEKQSENQKYSKITLSGNSDCFDSCDPENPDVIHFYYDHKNASGAPNQCYVFEPVSEPVPGPKALDVVFMQDLTGSQQPYIDAALKEMDQIWKNLQDKGSFAPGDLRFGAIGFRDHPPQDDTFPSKLLSDLTSDIDSVMTALASYQATGGGDSPESQADAMADALEKPTWNTKATKVAVLITDSPPHGINEPGDAWPKKCPCQKDPLGLAKRMYRMGITLYVIACEPTMSQYYQGARPFYEGLVQKTPGGKVYNLGDDPGLLGQLITGAALQEVDSNKLVAQHRDTIRAQAQAKNFNVADYSRKLHSELLAANVQHNTLAVDSMVESNPAGDKIAQIWADSDTLEEAHAKIQQLQQAPSRIKEEYLDGALPTASLQKKPISLAQVENVVQKCIHCEA